MSVNGLNARLTAQKRMTLTELSGNMSQLKCRLIPAVSSFFLDRIRKSKSAGATIVASNKP